LLFERGLNGYSGDYGDIGIWSNQTLTKKVFNRLLRFFISLAALLFLTAWTLDYWQAWLFLAVFCGSSFAITLYLAQHDPKLLERRMKAGPGAEKERSQRIIQLLALIAFIAVLVVPAIDHRFAWSTVPPFVTVAGDILVALGFLVIFFVFKENTFASAIIEVGSGQKVITTGPYALVRHPMYSGALVMLLGEPLALGSWWGLFTIIPITAVIVWRLLNEEEFLAKNLAGYSDYQSRVRYRLLPSIW
jgi:protein-S-isoprenylcysteine O-methyltransferase Ste14